MFVVVYKRNPAPFHASATGVIFTRVAECFVYGCLIPLIVRITPLHIHSRRVLTGVNQAMYPIVIIVLVALKRSPIDAGGLPSIDRPRDDRTEEGRESTVVFRHSTLRISVGRDGEDAIHETWTSDSPQDSVLRVSWQASTVASKTHAKDVRGIV